MATQFTHQFKGIDIYCLHIGGQDGFRFRFCFRLGLRLSLSRRRRNNRSLVQLQLCGNPIGFHGGGGFRQVNFSLFAMLQLLFLMLFGLEYADPNITWIKYLVRFLPCLASYRALACNGFPVYLLFSEPHQGERPYKVMPRYAYLGCPSPMKCALHEDG